MVSAKVENMFLNPNFATHFGFLESQLGSTPNGGKYICGEELTGADIQLSFLLLASRKAGLITDKYPKLMAYLSFIEENAGYKGAIKKAEEVTGEPYELF